MPSRPDHFADVVIVGGGPSAIGLLYGLLLPYTNQGEIEPRRKPNFTIALIERGGEKEDANSNIDASKSNPKNWFSASHPFLKKSEQTESVVYQSALQHGLHNRIIAIPTGKRIGGGMNINATIAAKPSEDDFTNWPSIWREEVEHIGTTSSSQTNKMSRIMSGIHTIEKAMRDNGALSTQNGIDLSPHHSEIHTTNNEEFIKVESADFDATRNTTKIQFKSFSCSAKKKKDRGSSKHGCSYLRVNPFDALIHPLLERHPHLKSMVSIYNNTQVERILVKEKRKAQFNVDFHAQGVECSFYNKRTNKSEYFNIIAKQKVILCAGAILSPALLLASGIGDIDILQREGIHPLQSEEKFGSQWQGVGKNLHDHFIVSRAFKVPFRFWKTFESINGIRGWLALDIMYTKEAKEKDETMKKDNARVLFKLQDASSASTIMPYVLSSFFHRHIDLPNRCVSRSLMCLCIVVNHVSTVCTTCLRAIFMIIFSFYPVKWIFSHFTAIILVCLLNPESNGSVSIRRKRTKKQTQDSTQNQNIINHSTCISRLSDFDIIVDPGYLTNSNDFEKVEHIWKVLTKITKEQWFPSSDGSFFEILPGSFYRLVFGNDFLKMYIADFGLPYFHWTGTNAMTVEVCRGSSLKPQQPPPHNNFNAQRHYVVDSKLQVRNVHNLHVCDASVIPESISGPTALTCMGLGYVASSVIIDNIS